MITNFDLKISSMYEFSTLLWSTLSVTSIKYQEEADKDLKWGSYKKSTFKCGLTAYLTIERVEWRTGTQTRSQIEGIRVLWIWRSWWQLAARTLDLLHHKGCLDFTFGLWIPSKQKFSNHQCELKIHLYMFGLWV